MKDHAAQHAAHPGLDDRLVVVAGGGRGIGLATVRRFLAQGSRVVVIDLAMSVGEPAPADAAGWQAVGGEVELDFVAVDLTDSAVVDAAAHELRARYGAPDVVVNAAGIVRSGAAEEMGDDDWARVIDINLTGTFNVCRAFGGLMLEAGRGAIVNIASMSASISNFPQKQASYNASKAGVVHLTKTLAGEWADRGVRVNSVSPGYIATELTAPLMAQNPEWTATWLGRTPMGRVGTPDEVASVILFLASPESSFMTGSDVVADGGYTVW